ncbi:uncharacterized protein LOC143146683 [Ptiloglossa arizonensis]|uniref:uncharacterized protein LOC143146683 n=1 Tax=Ptiloglossa arizonensis TaxID=3350558 RepID=UPI003FA09267
MKSKLGRFSNNSTVNLSMYRRHRNPVTRSSCRRINFDHHEPADSSATFVRRYVYFDAVRRRRSRRVQVITELPVITHGDLRNPRVEIERGTRESTRSPESKNAAEKAVIPNSGNKSAIPTQRNRTPIQSVRSVTHVCIRYYFSRDLVNNGTEDANKSQRAFARRSSTKSAVSPTSYKKPLFSAPAGSAMKLENQYFIKMKRYQTFKKDFMDKQKLAQDLYNDMIQLREKVIASGTKDPGKLEDLKIEVGSHKQHPQIEPIVQKEQEESGIEKMTIGNEFVDNLERQLMEIPRKSQNLCLDLLGKQTDFIAFVNSQFNDNKINEEGDPMVEVHEQLEIHRKDCESVQACLDNIKTIETQAVEELVKNARGMLEEFECHRAKLIESKNTEGQRELQLQLSANIEELQAERERSNQNKERLRQAEVQLQRARAKIRELEAHAASDEGKIQTLQSSVKNLENQMKQKDQTMEVRLKDMQKMIKSSECLISKVEKQRDSFETRLVELREKMTIKESETMNTIKEMSERLDAVTTEVGMERDRRQQAEEAFSELEERYKHLENKSNQLCELAEKNKDFTIIEGNHSENEVCLYNELQAAKAELKTQKELILQLQQEKQEIVALMHQAASHDEEDDSREKLAAELAFKTNELKNLMMQFSDLKKVAKNAQEKNGTLENQLVEIQTWLHSQSKEGGKAGLNAHAIELQQQLSDLGNNLAEAIRQKEELETILTQKQLELEQRDRVMREQSKFLKVRDELLEILKGKAEQENGDLSNSDENNKYMKQVNKQITAKTEAIQELYSALESKQKQIMRLEKMVKMMEDQQDRAQAQRTRLEKRIAKLEVTLQTNKEQRYSLQDYEDYTPRQISSDEEQPYICERCRQETALLEKDDGQWSDKDHTDDNVRESFHDWFTDPSTLEMNKYSVNKHNFHGDGYVCNSPTTIGSRKCTDAMYNLHEETNSMVDSSRESIDPYQRQNYPHHRHLLYYRIRPSLTNRTNSHEVDL